MQISLTHISETQVKLAIVASEKDLQPLKEDVLQSFQSRVKIPGFRKGKVPLALVEKNIDQNQYQSAVLEEAVNQMFSAALTEKKLRPVSNPEIAIKKFVPFSELSFEAEIQVVGEVKLPDYKKLKKSRDAVSVQKDDVQKVLHQLQERSAEKKDVDRAAVSGDEVYIDFSGVDKKGQPVNGAEGKNTPIILGSDTFIPGFEANLIGLKAGEEKTFTIDFPKDYSVKALAGRPVTFTVTIINVKEIVKAPLDDAFAASVGPFKSLEELHKDIQTQLEMDRQQESDQKYENDVIRELARQTKAAVPKILVDEQIDRIEEGEKQNILYRGQTWQEHLDEEGVSAEEHREQKRPEAEERVKASLALSAIAEQNDIQVSPEEFESHMALLRDRYKDPQAQAELQKNEIQREVASRLLTEKTIRHLLDEVEKSK